MSVCKKCWDDAHLRSTGGTKSQTEHYLDILSAHDHQAPQWTTEAPTEAGYYWAKRKHDDRPEPVWFELDDDPDWRVLVVGEDIGLSVNDFTHWIRIKAPEPPK